MPNSFVHLELNSTDVAKAKAFYEKLFDWNLAKEFPMPDGSAYTMIAVPGDGPGGGMLKNPMPGVPSFWLAYVSVDDVAAATKKAASLGAKVIRDVTPVEGMGKFSIIQDPTGAGLGLWESTSD